MCILDFSERKDSWLTLSVMLCASKAMLLKTRLFCSFQITQTEASQIILRNEWEERGNPARCPNWRRWSWAALGAMQERPNHRRTKNNTLLNVSRPKNKWFTVSGQPHPPTQILSSFWSNRRRTKLSFVGSQLRNSIQANNKTFNGAWLCHTSSNNETSPLPSTCPFLSVPSL